MCLAAIHHLTPRVPCPPYTANPRPLDGVFIVALPYADTLSTSGQDDAGCVQAHVDAHRLYAKLIGYVADGSPSPRRGSAVSAAAAAEAITTGRSRGRADSATDGSEPLQVGGLLFVLRCVRQPLSSCFGCGCGCALQFIGVEHNGRRLELLVMPGMMPGELRTLIQSTFKVGGVVALKGPGDQVCVCGSRVWRLVGRPRL